MNNEFDDAAPLNPFAVAKAEPVGGAVAALQKREETEVFAMVMMAKRFPREQAAAMDRILTSFQRPSLAEVAQYQFARGGTDIVGPSIRAAEAIAQEWGNIDTGWREISRGIGPDSKPYSELMAYAIDLQTTTRKALTFMVPHWRDTRGGGYKLKDERDIYELCANQAQRRLRACILALIPGDVIEQAMKQAEVTLRTKADTSPEAVKRMVEAFAPWGVTKEEIEKRIQRKLDSITPAQMVGLKRIYTSLRDDMSTAADWFDVPEKVAEGNGKTTNLGEIAARAAAAAATAKQDEAAKPDPTPAATAAPAQDKPAKDPQQATLLSTAPGAPSLPSSDDMVAKFRRAKSRDDLDLWASRINEYPDEAIRLRLQGEYDACAKKLGA